MSEELKIAIFQKKEIRKQLHNGQWWFVINDVVAALTDSADPAQYLRNMRNRDEELSKLFEPVGKGVVQIEPPLHCHSILLAESKSCYLGVLREFFV
jgi:prophage antirepressor-like protein